MRPIMTNQWSHKNQTLPKSNYPVLLNIQHRASKLLGGLRLHQTLLFRDFRESDRTSNLELLKLIETE